MLTDKQRKERAMIAASYRRAICTHCGVIMNDIEPCANEGDFYHKPNFANGKPNPCPYAGCCYDLSATHLKIAPLVSKKRRRVAKRLGVTVVDD